MTDAQLLAVLALQNVANIGDITAKKLINHCGSAEAVFSEKKQNLLKIDGLGDYMLKDLFSKHHFIEAETELQFIKENHIECLYFTDSRYPEN